MEWRTVPETKGLLHVTEDGLVYRESFVNKRGVLIKEGYPKQCVANNGYKVFRAFNTLYLVHRCVGECFVEGKTAERRYINHKDGVKTNNNYKNLEWVTGYENILHAISTGLLPDYCDRNYTKGNKHHSSKIPEEFIPWIMENFTLPKDQQVRQIDIARALGVSATAIQNIRKGRSWSWKTNIENNYE